MSESVHVYFVICETLAVGGVLRNSYDSEVCLTNDEPVNEGMQTPMFRGLRLLAEPHPRRP